MEDVAKTIYICSAAGDDSRAQINRQLLIQYGSEIAKAVRAAADKVGADETYIYIPEDYTDAIEAVTAPAEAAGIRVQTGADSPVCRDKTALLSAFNGKLIRPYYDEDEETLKGYDNIARYIEPLEPVLRASMGTEDKKLLYVSGAVAAPGFVEAAYGATVAEIVGMAGGVKDGSTVKAVLIGGQLGGFIAPGAMETTALDAADDRFTGSIWVLDQKDCAADTLKTLADQNQADSCGKCPLCREGTFQFAAIAGEITNGKAKATDPPLMRNLARIIGMGAFCQFGQHMVRPVVTALDVMGDEIEDHFRRKKCAAGVCKAFMTLAILPDKCTGCEECADVCPEDCIEGKAGYIHMIDNDMCEKCGKCQEVCEEDAIIVVGAVKPKLPKRLTRVGRFK